MDQMRRVILESPYASKTWWGRLQNKRYARRCLRDCLQRNESPLASHLLYTQPGVLKDHISEERRLGIRAGITWAEHAEATVVYVDRGVSGGMQLGITDARHAQRPIEYRTLYPDKYKRWDPSWGDSHLT